MMFGFRTSMHINKHPAEPANQKQKSDDRPTFGVNYNQFFEEVSYPELQQSGTKWVRGFFDFLRMYQAGKPIDEDKRVKAYLALKDHHYHTVLNLKFNFKGKKFPEKGSQELENQLKFIDQLLERVMAKTDVIVVGNEPFLESDLTDHNIPLNDFYQAAAARVHAYFISHHINKPIFIGSFNNSYLPQNRIDKGILNLLAFAKATSYISGIDVHIHHDLYSDINVSMDFLNDKIRDNQKMIITEFSLVARWRKNMKEPISPEFIRVANQNSNDAILPPPEDVKYNYQYINYALKHPRSLEEWNAYNQYSPWLEDSKDYLCTAFNKFKSYPKFWLAFYAIRQQFPPKADFTLKTSPWVLNGVLAGRTVELNNGKPQPRYQYFNDFKSIAAGKNPCLNKAQN